MKKIILVGITFLFIHCGTKTGEQELNIIINSYENYQSSEKEEYPLGNYTESRFETYVNFCDSLKMINAMQHIGHKIALLLSSYIRKKCIMVCKTRIIL